MNNIESPTRQRGRFRFGVSEKVASILLAVLLVTLGISSLLTLRAHKQDILEETDRRGHATVRFIAQPLALSVVNNDRRALELLLQETIRSEDIVFARVDDTHGNTMAAAGTVPDASQTVRHYRADLQLNGDVLGILHLSLSTERIARNLASRQREVLLGQVLAILVVMLAGFLAISALVIRPLTVVTHIIGNGLKSGDHALRRVPPGSTDEFGELAHTFNALQERFDEVRQKLEARVDHANQELQSAYQQLTAQTSELSGLNRELELLSVTDPLTGLYNRHYFEKLMDGELTLSIRNDETVSIILLDIDNFKEINEHHGHTGGDTVLRNVGRIIAGCVRHGDTACRYGGDEFFILCRNATISNAVGFADSLLDALAENPLHPDGRDWGITMSIGIATIPGVQTIATAEYFFHCANAALRARKQRGHNSVLHYSMLDHSQKSGMY